MTTSAECSSRSRNIWNGLSCKRTISVPLRGSPARRSRKSPPNRAERDDFGGLGKSRFLEAEYSIGRLFTRSSGRVQGLCIERSSRFPQNRVSLRSRKFDGEKAAKTTLPNIKGLQ